MFGTSRL